MKVVIYARTTSSNSIDPGKPAAQLAAAVSGFRRHGIEPVVLPPGARIQRCDLSIVWGVRKTREMASGKRCLVFERGYVGDRFKWTSVGFDGLNGRAKFYNINMPGNRWEKHFAQCMKPWRDKPHYGDYVLLLAQKPGDASLRGLDAVTWAINLYVKFQAQGIPCHIRWHPKASQYNPYQNRFKNSTILGPLNEVLKNAKWTVTFNSNSSVDSVLAGVPAVTLDLGAMAWDVTGHNPFDPPPMPDRTQWAHNLAYTQWSTQEIAAGEPLDHLRQAIMELK